MGPNRFKSVLVVAGLTLILLIVHQVNIQSFDGAGLNKFVQETSKCLRYSIPHPVSDRHSITTIDGGSSLSFGYPALGSVRTFHSELAKGAKLYLDQLNNSVTVSDIRSRPVEEKCTQSTVPKKLHWVWVNSTLPEKYVSNIFEMAVANLGWEVYLWSDFESKPLEEKLSNYSIAYNFKNVSQLLESGQFVNGDIIAKEENVAGKSDYLRMEVVYLEGGIYQDIDAHPVQPFDAFEEIFRWPFISYDPFTYQNACNCVFGFEKGSPFLEFSIRLTRENCLKFDNCGVMAGAGPTFITVALYHFDDPDIVLIDQLYMIRQWFTPRSVTYHTMDGTWRESYCRGRDNCE